MPSNQQNPGANWPTKPWSAIQLISVHGGVEIGIRPAGAHQQEPVGGRSELVGEPSVVRADTGVDKLERMGAVHRVEAQLGRTEVALEDELGRDALAIHLREPDVGVPEASPLP